MRDFRDAKAMAHTLRAALAAKGLKVTVSQSLELIAQLFGTADWNTLSAAIRREARTPRAGVSASPPPAAERSRAGESGRSRARQAGSQFSAALGRTLGRAIADAGQRDHEYTTLEHVLLALIDDVDASAVMKACEVDLEALRTDLESYIGNELQTLVAEFDGESRPTPAVQRVVQRALHHVQSLGRHEATGAEVLAAMFAERESPAVWLLGEHEMTQQDAANFILHRIRKASEDPPI